MTERAHKVRILIRADSWVALMFKLRKLTEALPAEGQPQHWGGTSDGATYEVDVEQNA